MQEAVALILLPPINRRPLYLVPLIDRRLCHVIRARFLQPFRWQHPQRRRGLHQHQTPLFLIDQFPALLMKPLAMLAQRLAMVPLHAAVFIPLRVVQRRFLLLAPARAFVGRTVKSGADRIARIHPAIVLKFA